MGKRWQFNDKHEVDAILATSETVSELALGTWSDGLALEIVSPCTVGVWRKEEVSRWTGNIQVNEQAGEREAALFNLPG